MSAGQSENVVWSLQDLYQAPDDPGIETDKMWCRKRAEDFVGVYKGKIAELEPERLLQAIGQFEELQERIQKLLSYAYLFFATQTQNPRASSVWQAMQEFHSTLRRDTLFFELEWTQLEETQALAILAHSSLRPYRHYLEALRRYKPHLLSEMEERILAEKEPTGTSAWCTLFDKVLSQLRFGSQERTESEVLAELYHADREMRRAAALELTEGLQGVLHVLAHIFNTVLLDKAITDRLRNYPHWLRERNLSNEAGDRMVESLVQAVSSRYDIVARYYRIKRRLLNLEELVDYDRYAPVPGLPDRVFQWEEAKEIVITAFASFSPRMSEIAGLFFDEGWIHAPTLPGKRSGAFAHPAVPHAHPYILLNYTGTYRDVMTLAHELGHGIHQYLARDRGLFNSETPLTVAETASVFGEMLVFRHLLRVFDSPRERLALRCSKLEDVFATVFRQVSMNRFEHTAHNQRRATGELDREYLSQIWMETQSAMFGDSVRLLDHYRLWWSYIPHFVHSPGYVYAYAFGELLVLALYRQYLEKGAGFVSMYLELLAAGGKERPEELLRPFGIDLEDPGFWQQGLTVLETLLEEAEGET